MALDGQFSFLKRARDGKWYTYSEFYEFHSVTGHTLIGDQSRLEALRRAKLEAIEKRKNLNATNHEYQCAQNELHTCAEQLTKHQHDMQWREQNAMWYWNRAHGLTSDDLASYHQVIWSWDKRPVDRDDEVEEDACFPYLEDCYPDTDEHRGNFYAEDRWHPPMSGLPRDTGLPCLYATAYQLSLSPPGYFVPVSQMQLERFTVTPVARALEEETLFEQSGDSANVWGNRQCKFQESCSVQD